MMFIMQFQIKTGKINYRRMQLSVPGMIHVVVKVLKGWTRVLLKSLSSYLPYNPMYERIDTPKKAAK